MRIMMNAVAVTCYCLVALVCGVAATDTRPFEWQNTTGWQWRILGGGDAGLLEVLPLGQSEWGTVCSTDFGIQEASAACHTLGYDIPYGAVTVASLGLGQSSGPIYMSDVWCPNPSTEYYLENCSFTYNLTTDVGCTHAQDVYIDCRGDMFGSQPMQAVPPRSFVSIVKTSNYTQTNFKSRWALFFNMSADRVVILNDFAYKDFSYVNWTMIDDSSTIGMSSVGGGFGGPFPPSPGGGGSYSSYNFPSSYSLPKSGSGSRGQGMGSQQPNSGSPYYFPAGFPSHSGSFGSESTPASMMDLGTLPSEVLGLLATMTYEGVLWDHFGIYEQRDNVTKPNGPVDPDPVTWRLYLESPDVALADRFGRVMLQPGADAMIGTACSDGTDATAALAVCKHRMPSETLATLIPYFRPYHGGVIYASNVHCNDTTRIDKCDYVASGQFEKNNSCTHLQDVGVLCGRGVVRDPVQPITYFASWRTTAASTPDVSNLWTCLSEITNIPVSRFLLTSNQEVAGGVAMVKFTFSSTDAASTMMITRGDCDLVLQSTNEWAMEHICNVTSIAYSAFIYDVSAASSEAGSAGNVLASWMNGMSGSADAPMSSSSPLTSIPMTTAAPATTASPVTFAPRITAAPTLATAATTAHTTTLDGNWSVVVQQNKSLVVASAQSFISSALGLPNTSVVIDDVIAGSLIIRYHVLSALAPDAINSLVKKGSTQALAAAYQAVTGVNASFSVTSSATSTPQASTGSCSTGCIGLVAVGVVALIAAIMAIVHCLRKAPRGKPEDKWQVDEDSNMPRQQVPTAL